MTRHAFVAGEINEDQCRHESQRDQERVPPALVTEPGAARTGGVTRLHVSRGVLPLLLAGMVDAISWGLVAALVCLALYKKDPAEILPVIVLLNVRRARVLRRSIPQSVAIAEI
ncbi:hypothetical protein PIB30_046080 [Stylosanthes scabra]|uniref:Uncharacterized protein n=1 Tax=Stylosanthes scabra TaxID=79078 RepID=A0ABU6UF09_9FABA|nr:hypothetical protein [Stylosanthes scabra]